MKSTRNQTQRRIVMTLFAILVLSPLAFSQTKLKAHPNKYRVEDDVALGRQAAAEVEQKLRIIRDEEIDAYINEVGRRLVQAIPPEFQQPAFQYSFKVVAARDINAFALPGGPMFVQTGMINAAKREGEMAGVMAHEISHVALRHATAQATKSAKWQTLGQLGAIGGAVLGGGLGSIIGQGAQMGAGAFVLKYGREFETEADVLGAQILARAGYDPRDLSEMFRTIEQTSGGSGQPQWMSSHPNPGNRYARIEQEAKMLQISKNRPSDEEFMHIKSRLAGGAGAYRGESTETGSGSSGRGSSGAPGRIGNPGPPSQNYRVYSNNNAFSVEIPDNWREVPGGESSIWFAPDGAYGEVNGQAIHTHGVLLGVARSQSQDLRQSIQQLLQGFKQNNPNLRQQGEYQRATLAGREAGYVPLSNKSILNGEQESLEVIATKMRNGSLLFIIALAPQRDLQAYRPSFQRFARSLQIRD